MVNTGVRAPPGVDGCFAVVASDLTAEWRSGGLGVDLIPNAGVSLGNVLTQASAGLTLRFGQDLANDYGPPRVRPAMAGAGFFRPREGAGEKRGKSKTGASHMNNRSG